MSAAKAGDTVRIHYTGRLTDGSQFDSSIGRDPLEFELGAGQIIPGLEQEILGMVVGTASTVTIPFAEAYGPRQDDAVQVVQRSAIPPHIQLDLGGQIQAVSEDGNALVLTVVALTDEDVTLDANHPLAGKDLIFDVELLEIL
ncbi:MAG: peptidylprolyl isomerase [Hyphomicrobiales bacterium]|nr:MAG: peptidylprolyl isomerase [Hyphomicrobiales bacterium]